MVDSPEQQDPFSRSVTIERFEAISLQEWERVLENLDSERSSAFADWRELDPARPLSQVMQQLASVRVSVPGENAETLRETHNRTIENHIKLALRVAGSRENLGHFLQLVQARLDSRPDEAQRRLAKQTLLIWAPAAEIADFDGIKRSLEEAAFPILHPDEYERIQRTYKDLREDESANARLAEFQEELHELLDDDLQELGSCSVKISSRKKTAYSVWRKAKLKGASDYGLSDFIGLRVVIDAPDLDHEPVEHCYAAAGLICAMYDPIPERTKDYIARPKANGYRSLHLTLAVEQTSAPLEVQVRTAEMNLAGEERAATSHMIYEAATKYMPDAYHFSNKERPKGIYRWRSELADLIRGSQDANLAELRADRILVFTPDGNLHELDAESTALDCSFAIHGRRALRTKQIRINGKPVAMNAVVSFGDCIDISYGKEPCWTPDWANRVNTKRASQTLRRAWKRANAEQLQASARQRIETYCLHEWGIEDPLSCLSEVDRQELARRYSTSSFEIVLREIGARVVVSGGKKRTIGPIVYRIHKNLGLPAPRGRFE